jgi:hypothetical protein
MISSGTLMESESLSISGASSPSGHSFASFSAVNFSWSSSLIAPSFSKISLA